MQVIQTPIRKTDMLIELQIPYSIMKFQAHILGKISGLIDIY